MSDDCEVLYLCQNNTDTMLLNRRVHPRKTRVSLRRLPGKKGYLHHVSIPWYHDPTDAENIVLRRVFEYWQNTLFWVLIIVLSVWTLSTFFLRSTNHWKKGRGESQIYFDRKDLSGTRGDNDNSGQVKTWNNHRRGSNWEKDPPSAKAPPSCRDLSGKRRSLKKTVSNSSIDKWESLSFARGIHKVIRTKSQKRELAVPKGCQGVI